MPARKAFFPNRMRLLVLSFCLLKSVWSDFECLCNYNIELPVYTHHVPNSSEIGTLYEFDCKPTSTEVTGEATYKAIQFEQQVGYVHLNENIQIQICAGDPSPFDIVTTIATTILPSTTQTKTFTSTFPSTITIASTITTTRSIATSTSTSAPHTSTSSMMSSLSSTQQGHVELCPRHVKADAHLKGGFLGQRGQFCYEFVNWKRAFDGAESHCKVESGTLASISNQEEQNFIQQFLASQGVIDMVWIGLSDRHSEGVLTWTSGVPVTYKNFQTGYNQHSNETHKYNDCFVIQNGGEWVDQPCGLAITIINLGETHPFICQYNISAKIGTFFDILPDAISVG